MKQIEYTEKQKIVLEVLEQVDNEFKPNENAYGFERKAYFGKIQRIKAYFGIGELFQTLREYINKHSCGAYHSFVFQIDDIPVKTNGVDDFMVHYNHELLDKYFVLKDRTSDNGGNCENYHCLHYLELVEKE